MRYDLQDLSGGAVGLIMLKRQDVAIGVNRPRFGYYSLVRMVQPHRGSLQVGTN